MWKKNMAANVRTMVVLHYHGYCSEIDTNLAMVLNHSSRMLDVKKSELLAKIDPLISCTAAFVSFSRRAHVVSFILTINKPIYSTV